jgi:VanZ family protein
MKLSMIKFLKYWLPVVFWTGLIFYFSSVPGLNSGMSVFYDVFWRKLAHATEFGILNLLLFRAIFGHEVEFKKALIWSFVLSLLYAVSDELHQYFVPDRECRLQDVGVDSLGVLLTSAVIYFIFYNWKKK